MTKRVRAKIARGSAELAILSLLDKQQLYGFEIAKRIEEDSGGALHFNLASLYPMLYTLEKRGWIAGRSISTLPLSIPCSTHSKSAAGLLDAGNPTVPDAIAATTASRAPAENKLHRCGGNGNRFSADWIFSRG
jgi:hypothetical protein